VTLRLVVIPVETFNMHVLTLFISLFLGASLWGDAFQESQRSKDARALWEKAIIAKGGRDQLYTVNSFVLSYQETVRNFLGIAVHRGFVERLYVFPDKSWGWDDGLPPPFRLSIRSVDLVVPIPAKSSCPRQLISAITPSLCLLDNPTPRAHAVDTCSGSPESGAKLLRS
jgi:hypothetical protein